MIRGRQIAAFLFAAALLSPPGGGAARVIDGVVAVVDGEPVTYSEVREVVAEGLSIPLGDADIYLREEKQTSRILRWIEAIVDAVLVRQELLRLGQAVSDKEVHRAIESVRKANNLTEEQFREALARDGVTIEGYRRRLRWQLERGAIVRAKKLKDVTVTEDELREFFRENAERFSAGAEVRVSTLFFPLSAGEDEGAVRARIAAQRAAELLRQGRTMEETAGLLASALPGVEAVVSDWVKTDDLGPEIRKEIGKLRTGETSAPFFTEAGGHIVTVLGRRGGKAPEFSEVRDLLAEELTDRRSEKAFADILSDLRKTASIDVRL